MNTLFQNVLTASFHGSVVILAVIVLRLILKRAPRKIICLLWLLAGLRLMMPFEIQSELSLQPSREVAQTRWEQQIPGVEPTNPIPFSQPQTQVGPENDSLAPSFTTVQKTEIADTTPGIQTKEKTDFSWKLAVPYIWAAVAGCFLAYMAVAYSGLKRRVRFAVRIPGGWECDNIDTAFILGFVRPKIYIPMGMTPSEQRYILAHERTHLEKGDHWFKMVGFLALAMHWFNPLVWVAYILLCKDIEVACDERVVQFMDLAERKEYSQALLNCSTNRVHLGACPVAFGEVSVRSRVLSVLNYRKSGFWISLLGVVAIVFVAICLVTSPAGQENTNLEDGAIPVTDIDGLIDAIAPDTVISLTPGTYNLTEARTYGGETGNPYCSWMEVYDGYELKIKNIQGLTIRGSGRLSTTIETNPRYAAVISLDNSCDVTLEGFTAGHTQLGECSGGVIYLEGCSDMDMSGLGLYGCGVVGLESWNSIGVVLSDSEIYDCSSSAVNLISSGDVTVSNCRIYRIGREYYGGWAYADISNSWDVRFAGCQFTDSQLSELMNLGSSDVIVENCVFTDNRVERIAFQGGDTNLVVGSDTYQNASNSLILEGNTFRNNSIRKWFTPGGSAMDAQGAELTEEIMVRRYGEVVQQPTEEQMEVHVSTVDELLAAIAPNREVILDEAFYDLSTATGYGRSSGDYYYWVDDFDGPGLVIQNVSNMTIRSADGVVTGHTVSAVPRYADVFEFLACSDITLSGFTAGHAVEPGSCMGGVLNFTDCDRITIDNCGLYGCGILGVDAYSCDGITVKDCDIYECSEGGVRMLSSNNIVLENNTFRDLGGDATNFSSCTNVTIDGEIWENQSVTVPVITEEPVLSEDDQRLKAAAMSFANAYVVERTKVGMKNYLSGDYDGSLEFYPDSGKEMAVSEVMMSGNYADDMEIYGCCMVEVLVLDDAEQPFNTRSLFLEMVREQGAWKVAYFALDRTEIGSLDSDIWNFIYTYCDHNEEELRKTYLEDPDGSLERYPEDTTPWLKWESVKYDGITNASLKTMDTYSCEVPLVTEDTEHILHIELRRRENPGSYLDAYGNTCRQTDWVVSSYGLIS